MPADMVSFSVSCALITIALASRLQMSKHHRNEHSDE